MKEIFEVFSRKTEEVEEKPSSRIIVDHRERNSLVIGELASLGIEIEMRELKVGDYLVGEVAIERKTVFDFISSMKNKRLIRQLEELQQYQNKLLIVEGIDEQELYTDSDEKIGMHPNAIRGFLLSILLKYKVPIIFTKDYKDTARFISVLLKKKSKETSLNVSKKHLNKKERIQFILEGFPGIGPKTAQKLLKKFKTLKNIMNASQEELKEEIGKKAEVFMLVEEKF